MMNLATQLGHLLREERLRQELSQGEIASRMACAVSFVQAIEYGKVSRRTDTYERYANALGRSIVVAGLSREIPEEAGENGGGHHGQQVQRRRPRVDRP